MKRYGFNEYQHPRERKKMFLTQFADYIYFHNISIYPRGLKSKENTEGECIDPYYTQISCSSYQYEMVQHKGNYWRT